MNLLHSLHVIAFCSIVKVIYCYQDYSDVLKTVALYYYHPLYKGEQIIKRNCALEYFSADLPTKVVIHGYIASRYHGSIEPIKNAYLLSADVNLIVADWSQGAYQPYDMSRALASQVARRISDILEDLIEEFQLDKGQIHVVGHSLGAHIAGNVGRYFQGHLGRVTGLDPASPLYWKWSPDAIRESDGRFVDIIHTCGEALGEIWPRGHIDFYPNNGLPPQPGCNLKDAFTLFSCSHFRAAEFFAESILIPNSFVAIQCVFSDILAKEKCTAHNSRTVIMGEYVPREARGTFYLRTYAISPYGRGNNSDLYS